MTALAHLFVYQKNTDLHALSAFEAVKRFMNKDRCTSLRRFVHWTMGLAEGVDAVSCVDSIVSGSYYVLNPNKEGFYLNQVPRHEGDGFMVMVDVRNNLITNCDELRLAVNKKCGVELQSLKKSVVWRCVVQADSYEDACDYVERELVQSVSLGQGILANPIYENYSILDLSFRKSTAVV